MKNCFRIYISDLKKLVHNWVALVIAIGIALLPCLYAWINILASWDPYGNTGGIKVGIVNLDTGSQIRDININIGDELVAELKENKKLGWTFFESRMEGMEKVRNGEVYATIIIPSDFSSKMATLLDPAPKKPELEYYVNEKINAIAPKMTDSGATTIQKTISSSFVSTVVEKIFEILNPLGYKIDDHYDEIVKFQSFLNLVDVDLPNVSKHINNLLDKADENGDILLDDANEDVIFLRKTLSNAIYYTDEVGRDAKKINDKTTKSAAEIKNCLADAEILMGNVSETLTKIQDTYEADPHNISEKILEMSSAAENLADAIEKLDRNAEHIYDVLSDTDREDVKNKIHDLQVHLNSIANALSHANRALNSFSYTEEDLEKIEEIISRLSSDANELNKKIELLVSNIKSTLEEVENLSNTIEEEGATEAIHKIDGFIAKLQNNGNKYSYIIGILNRIKARLENGQDISIDALKLNVSAENLLSDIRTNLDHILNTFDTITDNISTLLRHIRYLRKALDITDKALTSTIRSLKLSVGDLADLLDNVNDILVKTEDMELYDFSSNVESGINQLRNLTNNLNELSTKIENSEASDSLNDTIDSTILLASDTKKLLNSLVKEIDGDLVITLQNFLTNVNSASGDLNDIFNHGIKGLDKTKDFLDKLDGDRIKANDLRNYLNDFETYSDSLDEIANSVRELSDKMDLMELADIMKNDGSVEGDFFSSPVELNTTKVFSMKNYGAGLTPFYTTLCLWVGGLLVLAIFTTKAHNADFPYTPNEEYIGKFLLFATIALIQGLLASLGDVFILRVEMVHPVLFICLSMFYSVVFITVLYTLVALLNNVGKAIGVVFLVFQLAGSGGTFPIQCTPPLFQKIYKFLPFTYAINGMREAVGGINYSGLLLDIAVISLVGIIFMIIGLIGKRYANEALAKFTDMLEESGVTH